VYGDYRSIVVRALAARSPDLFGRAKRSSPKAARLRAAGAGLDGESADRATMKVTAMCVIVGRGLDRRPHASPCGHRWCRVSSFPTTPMVAVIKACLYEPQVNRTYAEMAAHRGFLLASALIYRRLPSANDKCPLNSFLDVRNKLLVA